MVVPAGMVRAAGVGGKEHPNFRQLPQKLCVFLSWSALGVGSPGHWDLPSRGRIMLPVWLCGWQGLEYHSFGCHWDDTLHLCAWSVLAGFIKMGIPSHDTKLQADRAKDNSFSRSLQRSVQVVVWGPQFGSIPRD